MIHLMRWVWFLALMPVIALAAEDIDLIGPVASPELVAQEVQAIERREPSGARGTTQLITRIEALENTLQGLTGQIEQLNHQINTLRMNYEKLSGDLEVRFREVSMNQQVMNRAPMPAASMAAAPALSAPAHQDDEAEIEGNSKQKYTHAKNLFNGDNYAGAEKAFRAFIAEYPKDVFAASAHYWLGETQLQLNQPKKALVTFMKGYKNYPASKKTPENLMGMAKAFARMGDKSKACTTLETVETEYPKLAANLKESLLKHKQNFKCS